MAPFAPPVLIVRSQCAVRFSGRMNVHRTRTSANPVMRSVCTRAFTQRIPKRMRNLYVDVARVMEQRQRSRQLGVPVQRAGQDVQRQVFLFPGLIRALFAHKFGLFPDLSRRRSLQLPASSRNSVAIPGVIASAFPAAS